jgi:hypothetical protein
MIGFIKNVWKFFKSVNIFLLTIWYLVEIQIEKLLGKR